MARRVKTLQNKVDNEVGHGYAHRDHRSKKNRKLKDTKTYSYIKKIQRFEEERYGS